MDFDRWFSNQTSLQPRKLVKQLTEDAQLDRDDFKHNHPVFGRLSDQGCTCFTGYAPCSWCLHPGNPLNQDIDEAWELVPEDEVTRDTE